MSSTQIAITLYMISIIILAISGIIVSSFVIPLQWKEAGVKNGLAFLRRQLLAKGFLALVTIITAIIALTIRSHIADPNLARIIISSTVLLFSLSLFGKAGIDYKVYHQQYTDENKELHRKFDIVEKRHKAKLDKTAEKEVK